MGIVFSTTIATLALASPVRPGYCGTSDVATLDRSWPGDPSRRVPGFVTVTVLPATGLTVYVNDVMTDGPVESVAVMVTNECPWW